MGVPNQAISREGKATAIEPTIARFRRTYRRRLRRLARQGDQLADLIVAFPAVAFAIVTEHATIAQRRSAIDLIKVGQPLKAVAKAIGVPFWMRKLPPEALGRAFPNPIPGDEAFGGQIVGLVPKTVGDQAGWLFGVLEAHRLAGAELAHWLARHPRLTPSNAPPAAVQYLALLAWYSSNPQTYAARFLPGKWSDRVSPGRAGQHARDWQSRLETELALGPNGLTDPWLAGGRAGGYRFVPIASLTELAAEADAMDTCVRDYAHALATGRCRLFGVRRGALRVATLEVRPHELHDGIPQIVQLRGRNNEDVPVQVWRAAFTWLGKQGQFTLPSASYDHCGPWVAPDAATWRQLWRPYWQEMGDHPLLPQAATPEALADLRAAAMALAQRAGR